MNIHVKSTQKTFASEMEEKILSHNVPKECDKTYLFGNRTWGFNPGAAAPRF